MPAELSLWIDAAFPHETFDRWPLSDLREDSGPILAVVFVKFVDTPRLCATPMPISTIGIELYGTCPNGVAVGVGGRFAPKHSRRVDRERSTSGRRGVNRADGCPTEPDRMRIVQGSSRLPYNAHNPASRNREHHHGPHRTQEAHSVQPSGIQP
jgi:hypothetical protein